MGNIKIKVECGTEIIPANKREMWIDLDEYGERKEVGSSEQEQESALALLADTMDENFAYDGNRNTSAVNSMIALHVLGYDAAAWLACFMDVFQNRFWASDARRFLEHVERVEPYLAGWGPKGDEGRALAYEI